MNFNTPQRYDSPNQEGGLRAPSGLSFWGKAWWWFHFLILLKLARLRFIAILVAIGLVIVKWDTLNQHYLKWTRPVTSEQTASSDHEYYCPMHPTVIRDTNKEKCPVCFMPLSRRKKGMDDDIALPPGIVNRVQLSPYRIVQAGIRTWQVTHLPLVKDINTVGLVEFNERLMTQVAARVKGRIDKLAVNETGQMVHLGQELASLYSPELQVTVQNLLDAQRAGNATLFKIARDRLKLWGGDDEQLKDIVDSGKAPDHLKIRSPMKGHVLKKYVKEGQYVEEGMPLYDIADLDSVWIQAQVWEEDMAFLPTEHFHLTEPGAVATDALPMVATARAYPGELFEGKLSFVFPHVDYDTRTVVVRCELPNQGHKLRPGTSVNVKLKVPASKLPVLSSLWKRDILTNLPLSPVATFEPLLRLSVRQAMLEEGMILAVREDALIDTGSQKIVYREVLPGEYEGVLVELGPRMQGPGDMNYYPVLAGLEEGDKVVTAGSFLLDAETRLNPAAGSIYFGGSGSAKPTAGGASVKPSTPDDEDAKIRAALARIPSDRDRQLAQTQRLCPIQKESRLGSMGVPVKLMVLGQPVFLCCKGCEQNALSKPRETVTYVEKLRKK